MKPRMPHVGSLGARALNAGGWNAAITLSNFGLRLVSNLIMTRLLVPEAFGMMAMANTLLTALALFTDIGIGRSISREPDGDTPHFLRVAWVVKIMRSAVVASGVLLMALLLWLFGAQYAPADSVYAQPEMPGLIALVALSPLLLGLSSTSWDLAVRRLEYKRFAVFGVVSQLASIAMMITLATISPTVWALMSGMLFSNVLECLFTHRYLPGPKMRFAWDAEIAARLWAFGKWLLGSSAISFFARNADKLLLGVLLGAINFGIYTIAQIWLNSGRTFIARLSEGVGFPAIAEVIRTRPEDVPRLYKRYQMVIDVLCFSAFLVTYLLGQILIEMLYTSEYHTAGPYLQLMSVGFLMLRFDPLAMLIINLGNSRASMITAAMRLVAVLIFLPIGYTLFGVPGAIMAGSLSPAIAVPYLIYLTRDTLGSRQTQMNSLLLILLLGVAALVFLTV